MSPSDKIIAGSNSKSKEGQTQGSLKTCSMNSTPELSSASTSDGSLSGKISSIPLITASLSTLKCSISGKMKTFDPGEESAIERLTNNHCGRNSNGRIDIGVVSGSNSINNCSGLIKTANKNYKAGSKINKLADMLAKRSQNVVEVTQNDSSSIISDISVGSKTETNEVDSVNMGNTASDFRKTANGTELESFRKNRRKSVPNQTCNFSQLKVQSTSKSCLDLSSLFTAQEEKEKSVNGEEKMAKPKFNALRESMLKLQTDESTKRKAVRKNLKNVELTLILPEKKRRFSTRNDSHLRKKGMTAEAETIRTTENPNETRSIVSPVCRVSSTNSKRETRGKQRRSKRLVETSTQTADIEFITLTNDKGSESFSARESEFNKMSLSGTECVRCSQILPLEREWKEQPSKNAKPVIKCQFCSRKLPTVEELKLHYVKKHPNKYVHCLKCVTEEKLDKYSEEIQFVKESDGNEEDRNGNESPTQENKYGSREEKEAEKSSILKSTSRKGDLKIDVSYEGSKKCSISPRTTQKYSPKEVKTEEQLIEMEMLFYSHLSGNIQENLANHLDGKMGKNTSTINMDRTTVPQEGSSVIGINHSTKGKGCNSSSAVVPFVGIQEVPAPRAPSPYRTRSKTPNPLPPATAKKFKKLPNWQQKFWEKYNFPTNYRYEHRFWDKNYLDTEKSALFLKDLSCLDIKTQLTMRENIKKLDSVKVTENENSGGKNAHSLTFPEYLSLMPKVNGTSSQKQEEGQFSDSPMATAINRSRRPSRKELPLTTIKTRREVLSEAKRQADKMVSDGGKVTTRRQNSLDLLMKEETEDSAKKRKGSLDLSMDKRMTLRRQISADNLQKNGNSNVSDKANRTLEVNLTGTNAENAPLSPIGTADISGEWVKPRSYLCGACCAKFSNLWDLEDHKWVSHPNVWCTHYEFEDEKIEKLFQMNEVGEDKGTETGDASNVRLSDLYKRYLLPHGTLKTAKLVPSTNYPEQCTKCKKNCMNLSEMHKHMLDCGGDTTWFLTMFSSPMTVKRKWRPFGSRRRKQIGRQIKRNIPNTPNIRSYHYQQHRIRTKPGDVESIQKMLANLPEKRARRAINFDEIKTRSQVTIHSNRMLRKRFKSSFANNYLKMKNLNQRRPLKCGKKEGSSKSTTDTSSESTPVASPKRRNKLREAVQGIKEESGADVSNESSNDGTTSIKASKKNQTKKNSNSDSPSVKGEDRKSGKQVRVTRDDVKMAKPMTRSNSSASSSPVERTKRKLSGINVNDIEVNDSEVCDEGGKKVTRSSTVDLNSESSTKKSRVTEKPTNAMKIKADKGQEKKSKFQVKVKEPKESEEKEEGSFKSSGDAILRLKPPSTREKTDIMKKLNKTLTNVKKLADETKDSPLTATESSNGSRRSLRLKSLQGEEESVVIAEEFPCQIDFRPPKLDSYQKETKIKRFVSEEGKSGDDCSSQKGLKFRRSDSGEPKKPKLPEVGDTPIRTILEKKTYKETKELETPERLRRSMRCKPFRSISVEEKMYDNIEKNHSSSLILRKHSKNISDDAESDDSASVKGSPKLSSLSEVTGSGSVLSKAPQPSLPATRRLSLRSISKDIGDADLIEDSKHHDLEEMPILAKVEPIQGKFYRKKEEEDIPVLMPAMEVANRDDSKPDVSIRFQIVKKRNTTTSLDVIKPKEVAPLKIIKKVDHSAAKKNGEVIFQLEEKTKHRDSSESSKPKRRMSSKKEIAPPEVKPCKRCKRCSKYFLGICPCEIDKGKEDGNDDSGGSDSEPLIMLINQSQKNPVVVEKNLEDNERPKEVTSVMEKTEDGTKEVQPVEEKLEVVEMLPLPLLLGPEEVEVTVEESVNETVEVLKDEPQTNIEINPNDSKKVKKKRNSTKKDKDEMVVMVEAPTLLIQNSEVVENPKPETKEPHTSVTFQDKEKEREKEKDKVLVDVLPGRRSRRISKETKSTNEFVIDDPLILVDELWSDLDSDSETTRKRSKKSKKKVSKKKFSEERKNCAVDLEELLRNFGENKESQRDRNKAETGNSVVDKVVENNAQPLPAVVPPLTKPIIKRPNIFRNTEDLRQKLENRSVVNTCRRLSLKLFRFNKFRKNFGSSGQRLWEAKLLCRGLKKGSKLQDTNLPDLPFLVAEIKENPVQVIQCRAQKHKSSVKHFIPPLKRGRKPLSETKYHPGSIHLKISVPLESINNLAVFNNNHLTELDIEKQSTIVNHEEPVKIEEEKHPSGFGESIPTADEPAEFGEIKNKIKRSDVIDKIFYCEICQTYYYSSSQLKIHKLSNRHKIKEAELLCFKEPDFKAAEPAGEVKIGDKEIEERREKAEDEEEKKQEKEKEKEEDVDNKEKEEKENQTTTVNHLEKEPDFMKDVEPEKINEDTLEMPTLEGPFLEAPITRADTDSSSLHPPTPPITNPFKFCQESLKDIQRAIGCTDEEMLILTLLGENTIEIENDILDLDTGKPVQSNKSDPSFVETSKSDNDKGNGIFKVDLKQRMTSALTCLVNKAVFNLLQKYESVAKSSINPEAVSLLSKLSSLSRRQNILQLNDLLKRQKDGEPSVLNFQRKDTERKEPTVSYKYQCTICGSRFEKASTRECHISRSHKGKAKKFPEDVQVTQTSGEDDWNDYWSSYDTNEFTGNPSQFWCSDCGINFVSPQEVLEHQKLEHQASVKETDRLKDASPLQSSTIGSSDEIILEGKKTKRRSKIFSSEELNKQRILANNELRKLDRKFSGKSKAGKLKWGMDALKFTVQKEKDDSVETAKKEKGEVEDAKDEVDGIVEKSKPNVKDVVEPVPKLNFTRTSNVSEFKVIQKNSLKSRFQKIIDNKLKRKSNRANEKHQQNTEGDEEENRRADDQSVAIDNEQDETETEVMLVPIVVKKKNKKSKPEVKKNTEEDKTLDIYDFNDSDSETEPMVLSHIKKPMPLTATKLKLVKVKEKEEPSKNKADSTTKDLAPDDYDSEDSLPLSIVKKSKSGEDDEKASEDGAEKSEGILEQVEYLIEQLENETGTVDKENESKEDVNKNSLPDNEPAFEEKKTVDKLEGKKVEEDEEGIEEEEEEETRESPRESLKVSLASSLLALPDLTLPSRGSQNLFKEDSNEKTIELAEPETSQSTFDEEDSMPLVLMSRRPEDLNLTTKDENTTDVSTTASEDVQMFREKEKKEESQEHPEIPPSECNEVAEETGQVTLSPTLPEGRKPFENLDGNVIYCRNESMSNFESDFSNDELVDSNYEKLKMKTETTKDFLKEVTEKEDVVIVCSKSDRQSSKTSRGNRKRVKPGQRRRRDSFKNVQRKRKKRFPLLTATIEENNFRRTEEPGRNKEVIVRKIWNRRKLVDESSDPGEDSFAGLGSARYRDEDDDDNTIDHQLRSEESQTEIEKELIVNKIWSRKKLDHENEVVDKVEDIKINQTEVSDEVVIKCGPKTVASPKRRQRSKSSTNEASKETIMRKIWSGKCMFQTKAALKTYESDVTPERKETETVMVPTQEKQRKRGRPSRFSTSTKKIRLEEADKDDEDDLDSLLEEIEREQLEKAIRLEFLQLRRSEKGNMEIAKEGVNTTMGLFTETSVRYRKDGPEKKRKKIRRNLSRMPRQSLLKRKKFIKKPIRRVLQTEGKCFADKGQGNQEIGGVEPRENLFEVYPGEGKIKSRKHKKHRHKHHHHKHKHKKSKHRKCLVSKHKSKHKSGSEDEDDDDDEDEDADDGDVENGGNEHSDTRMEEVAEPEKESLTVRSGAPDVEMSRLIDTICQTVPGQIDPSKSLQLPSPFTFEDSTKDCDDGDEQPTEKDRPTVNVYEFAEDVSDLSTDAFKSRN